MVSTFVLFALVGLSACNKLLNLTDFDNTMANETLFSPLYNLSVEWGVYKPDLYFGAKNRQDKPMAMGLFWYQTGDNQTVNVTYVYAPSDTVTAHYEFCDGSSASRQNITD